MEEKKRKKKAKSAERTERKANWQEVYATVDDIQQFLSERVMLRFNVVTRRVEVHWLTDFGDAPPDLDDWTMLTDRVVNSLWVEMSQQKPVRVQDIFRVIESDYVAEYNPFAFYLERLPPWNGDLDHILGLSMSVMVKGGTDEQFLFAEYLKKWLVGMVAAWVNPQVVNNVILVLIGQQGAYKTTWFNYLLPPELRRYFYTKTNASRMSKDDLLVLAQYGLVCCEELDTMRPAELNQLKAAVTMLSVDERAAYARYHEHRPHIASFCGTGNSLQFLSDPTGNRRWLPFEVESIEPPHDNPLDYRNIYSQAYSLYRKGFRYWFTQQ
jgi:predicted P-loop ATPase